MFWRKKQITMVPVVEGTTATVKTVSQEKKDVTQNRVESRKAEKLPGPRLVPGYVEKHIATTYKIDEGIVRLFKIAMRKRPGTERAMDCRIFDPQEAEAIELNVRDYTSLDEHSDLVLYEGWFDEGAKKVELTEKRKVNYDITLFTEAEILKKIEDLKEPGSSVFFYQNTGSAAGGPLGRGAAVIELNPDLGNKKAKKYIIYTANLIGTEPVGKRNKLYDADKPKEIAKWIAMSHKKRMY
jgi:hypothetical protein